MIGKTVSHYKIIEKVGAGGMGLVYKAQDTRLDRFVALKFLPPQITREEEKQRFIHEAKSASALQHNNICSIHEIDETDDGQIYICMDYYQGQTLDKKINKNGLSFEEAINIAQQLASGLAKAHEKEIVHRDIKPANIMLTEDGVVKILDFGLAKLSTQTKLTKEGTAIGTAAYMSPEQARGQEVDYRADIWAFGCVFYEMLCGKNPFAADHEQAIIYSILNEQQPFLKDVRHDIPLEIAKLIDRCLSKNPDQRYQSVKQISTIIQQYQSTTTHLTDFFKIFLLAKIKDRKKYMSVGFIFIIIVAVSLVWIRYSAIPAEKHIAVLPLANIDHDKDNQVFCDGLHEIITSRLTRLQQNQRSMWVIPNSEIRESQIESAREAYRKFDANLVITGSLQKRSDYLLLILNLVDATSFRQLKSDDLKIFRKAVSSKLEQQLIEKISVMLELPVAQETQTEFFAGGTSSADAYDYYIQGKGYLQRLEDDKNIDLAIHFFKKALHADSLFSLAWAGLGEAYWRKYDISKNRSFIEPAKKACQNALKGDKKAAEVYLTSGLINKGSGQYEKAVFDFKKALEIDSLNVSAYWELAMTFILLGDSLSALQTQLKAITKRPGLWQGYNNLGYFYLVNGDYEKAIQPYLKVIKLLPQSDIGYINLAATYFYLDRFSEAAKYGEMALAKEPSYSTINNVATFCYYAGNYSKSAEIYREAVKINENDYSVWGNLANAYNYSGEKDSAQKYYHKAVEMAELEKQVNPRNNYVLSNLAGYYAELNKKEKALEILRQIEEMNPAEPYVFFNMGDAYEQLGCRDLAIHWMEKAIKSGYTLAKFKNNPALEKLIADEKFRQIIVMN